MSSPVKVWLRFTRILNGKELKFRIQELPKEQSDEVFKLFFDYFATEESIHVASQITKSDEAFNEYKYAVNKLMKELNYQIDACCIDDGSEDLKVVAGSVMVLERRSDPNFDEEALSKLAQTKEMKTLINISKFMANMCKVNKKFNLDLYFDDRGIVVHPDYRRLGIAGELFKAREVACRDRGVPMTGAWMTSVGSQRAAAKLGWETVCELNYKDLEEKFRVPFEGVPPTCKLMIFRV